MVKFRGTSALVKEILANHPQCRNSDEILYLHILRRVGAEKGLDIDKMSIPMFLLHCSDLDLPPYKTVARTRRKAQELYPELRGSERVTVYRELEEERYREFAHEVI